MKIDYKLMDTSHINSVYELSKTCFSVPWSLESISYEIENPLAKYVIAQDLSTKEVLGFAGVWIVAGEGDITNIAVNPSYRKQGIASQLLSNLIEICHENNCNDITLEVRISNIPAQNLYTKLGFVNEGIRKKYYSDNGEDAIIMWKRG